MVVVVLVVDINLNLSYVVYVLNYFIHAVTAVPVLEKKDEAEVKN